MMEPDQAFLEYVVKALVDHPESVQTIRSIDPLGVLLQFTVHPDDMGKIIGKKGKTMEVLRILLHVIGMKGNARVNLKLNEPIGGKRLPVHIGGQEHKTVDQIVDGLDA